MCAESIPTTTVRRQAIRLALWLGLACCTPAVCWAETVALWLFDEQQDLSPSCVLGDAASGDFPLVLGLGGQIKPGKFGNALEFSEQPRVKWPSDFAPSEREARVRFGVVALQPGGTSISWKNANFGALMTRGEKHLRQEVGFGSPTASGLNLGNKDWTIEFWYLPGRPANDDGVVFEVGSGPRGADNDVTRLLLNVDQQSFTLTNQPANTQLRIATDGAALAPSSKDWCHLAFVFDATASQLRHYVNGTLQSLPKKCRLTSLTQGEEDYMSVGRDGLWKRPLPGRIDELRFSDAQIYVNDFAPPGSFSKYQSGYSAAKLHAGPPLLFQHDRETQRPIPLGGRKHLFIDNALLAEIEHVEFRTNPPRLAERVLGRPRLGNHLVIFEDRASHDGLIRLYGLGPRKSLAVWTSEDGIHFEAPDLGREYAGARNVVIEDPVGLGTIFLDPNAPSEERIKYFSGYRGRGTYIYSSPDGFNFVRNETSSLPLRAASQSIVYYDDQRQVYVGFHRSDMRRTAGGKTARTFVMSETTDLMRPWPLNRVSQAEQTKLGKSMPLGRKNPYYVDNGPLTPPGFGVEYPTAFAPVESLDPVGTDIYVPKCVKYAWAEDTYLAFPIVYFHYHGDGPLARRQLGAPEAKRGSGPLETQLAVSRDGIHWKRYPRPAYLGIGRHEGLDLKKAYIAHGMVRRGDEIWQYYVGSKLYHSSWKKKAKKDRSHEAVFRVVQRVDGFVSADTPYTGGQLTTRPLTFTGNRLVLNIDTDAAGYAQVGLLDSEGKAIEGFGLDQCIYINGDFVDAEVEWLDKGKDISALAGQPVQVVIRSRGTKLYSMQFVER